jgi:hypothetical protein
LFCSNGVPFDADLEPFEAVYTSGLWSSRWTVCFVDFQFKSGQSTLSKGFGRRQAYVNPDMYDPRCSERWVMGISASDAAWMPLKP